MDLDHLPDIIVRHVEISPNWAYLLRAEIKKVQAQLLKLDEAHLREGNQKRGYAKKYLFDHGIKRVRRLMDKHGTVTSLQHVDHPCPTGLHFEIFTLEHSRPNLTPEMHDWMSSLPSDKYEVTHRHTYCYQGQDPHRCLCSAHVVAPTPVSLLVRTDIDIIHWALDQGNLITAVEFFFRRNAYHPFAQCSYLRNTVTWSRLPRFYRRALELPLSTAKRFITAHTTCVLAWTQTIFALRDKK